MQKHRTWEILTAELNERASGNPPANRKEVIDYII